MKKIYDQLANDFSAAVTKRYSTSFSLGILFLNKSLRQPIYSIYGFVRLADEIVDSFHGYDKRKLLQKLRKDTFDAISDRISVNPILHAFQEVVHQYHIDHAWIDSFLISMEMDLDKKDYSQAEYEKYIFGSAEAVGLMCLHVFTEGNRALFERLKEPAMKLGAAFQKVNFLRDAQADNKELGRTYFPGVNLDHFTLHDKRKIEQDIRSDFDEALQGILNLPHSSRRGVFLAYYYYLMLFNKIKKTPPQYILSKRIRIPNYEKVFLMLQSNLALKIHLL